MIRIVNSDDKITPNENRRRQTVIAIFSKKIPPQDRFWWNTLSEKSKYEVWAKFIAKSRYDQTVRASGQLHNFLESIMDKFPGDTQLVRKFKLKKILKPL